MLTAEYMDAMEFDMNSFPPNNSVNSAEVVENQLEPTVNNSSQLIETTDGKNEMENMGVNTLAAVLQILQKHHMNVRNYLLCN